MTTMRRAQLDDRLIRILACPVCSKGIRQEDDALVCDDCGRHYPVVDGVPVMLPEEALSKVPTDEPDL